MNAQRKRTLREICWNLVDSSHSISVLCGELKDVIKEEDEARESVPENLVNSSSYEISEECSEAMDEAINLLEDVTICINQAIDCVEKII